MGVAFALRRQLQSLCASAQTRLQTVVSVSPLVAFTSGVFPPSDLVLLTDPRLVLEPDLYRRPALIDADGGDDVGEVFLNAAMASSSWA